jgi:hypothetical protein
MQRKLLNLIVAFLGLIVTLPAPLYRAQAAGTTITISNVVVVTHRCYTGPGTSGYIDTEIDITINVPDPGASAVMRLRVSVPGTTSDNPSSLGTIGPGPITRTYLGRGVDTARPGMTDQFPPNTVVTFIYYDANSSAKAGYTVNCTTGAVAMLDFTAKAAGGNGSAVEFYDPYDARIDPRPGDRLAVYCNQKDQVVVYGIDHAQADFRKGFLLAVFKLEDIKAAGDKGLTRNLGENGTLSISLIKGWYWVAWNGGQFNATGQDIWVKNFAETTCTYGQ